MTAEKYISDLEFNIYHGINQNFSNQNSHSHDEIEIYIHKKGCKSLFIENRIYDIKPNDIVIVNSNQIHQFITYENETYERYIIVYKEEFLMGIDKTYPEIKKLLNMISDNNINIFTLPEKDASLLITMLESYDKIYKIGTHLYKLSKFLEIITFIFNYLADNFVKYNEDRYVNVEMVQKILDEINKYFKSSQLTINFLSQKTHISKFYMCDIFKKNTGITIFSYINQKRVIEAKNMLKNGYSIIECSEQLGFGSYNNFLRTFKKITNTSPYKFARKAK